MCVPQTNAPRSHLRDVAMCSLSLVAHTVLVKSVMHVVYMVPAHKWEEGEYHVASSVHAVAVCFGAIADF